MRWVILVLAGCGFHPQAAHDGQGDDGPPDEAGTDTLMPDAFTPVTFVQSASNDTGALVDTSVAVTLPQARGAGDLTVVVVEWNDLSALVVTVNDNAGVAYQAAGPIAMSTSYRQQIYYAAATPAGAATITSTLDRNTFIEVRVVEYSGIAPTNALDGFAGAAAATGTMLDSGPVTTHHAHDLLVDAMLVSSTTPAVNGTGFTQRVMINGDTVADREVPAVGTYNATATHSDGQWIMQVAAFAAAD